MSPVNHLLEPEARVARLVLVPEISRYALLKHLGGRDNDIGTLYKRTVGVSGRLCLFVIRDREPLENKFRAKYLNKYLTKLST